MWPAVIACRKSATKIGTDVDITISRGVPKVAYCKTPVASYVLHKNHVWKKLCGEYIFQNTFAALCKFYKIERLHRFLFYISNNLQKSTIKNTSRWLLWNGTML